MSAYISQKGTAETVVIDKNNTYKTKNKNSTKWNAEYDGENANILIDTNTNGHKSKYLIQLDSDEIADLFSVPSVNKPLDIRLKEDFQKSRISSRSNTSHTPLMIDHSLNPDKIKDSIYTHISSPSYGEEFIIPVSIHNPRRKTRRKKHRTYRVKRHTKYTPHRRHSTPERRKRRKRTRRRYHKRRSSSSSGRSKKYRGTY
jgi:hypothetical protein